MCMIEMLFSKMGNAVFYMQNGYDRVVEKATPRPPAELDFKANITEDQKLGVAVGVMLENNKAGDVSWVRKEVKRVADEREAFEIAHRHEMPADADPQEWEATLTSPNIFLQPGESAERKLALFKDKHLRLLLTAVGYQRLGVAEDTEASWILPGELSSAKLNDIATKIQQAEFDPPTFDGRSATDMIKPKGSYVRRETNTGPFGDASDAEEGASDADADPDAPMFPPNLREKRKQAEGDDEEAPKKKRRLQRRNTEEDPTDSDAERRAESRREKERERNERIKSKLFVTASDDESDAEGDAEFFRLEEERRQKMKGIIRNQLLAEMNEVGKGDGGKKKGKKEVRAKAKEVARALGEDEDDLVDGVLDGMDVDAAVDGDGDEDEDDGVVDVPSSSPTPVPLSPGPMDIVEEGGASEKEAPIAVPDDDEEEDDAPANQRAPARRMRAGFVLDDSDSDE
jgi:replication fork protection complex subunit Tof1/Swi1